MAVFTTLSLCRQRDLRRVKSCPCSMKCNTTLPLLRICVATLITQLFKQHSKCGILEASKRAGHKPTQEVRRPQRVAPQLTLDIRLFKKLIENSTGANRKDSLYINLLAKINYSCERPARSPTKNTLLQKKAVRIKRK